MRRSSLCVSGAAAGLLLLAGCGARPQLAVGVSQGPTVHQLVCDARKVVVRRVAETPPFDVRVSGQPVMRVTRIPAHGILRGDGRVVTAAQFLDGRDGYCNAARQDRAAAIAAAFAGVVLLLAYLLRRRRLKQRYR